MLKRFAVATLLLAVSGVAIAAPAPIAQPAQDLVIQADWQVPQWLPPRLRNHCYFENFSGSPYCSDHCGSDYQVYFCSQLSFGCCKLGRGYCDWSGHLRCRS